MSRLTFLPRKTIRDSAWNDCVLTAAPSLPYAFTWYLDAVAENWDALVWGDYEAVMPLVWLRKWGIKCLYQPYFCQQLGIFSHYPLIAEEYALFLQYCKQNFPYLSINLNPTAAALESTWVLTPKKNLLLRLSLPYATLQKNYSDNLKRNIAKAHKAGLTLTTEDCNTSFAPFYIANIRAEKKFLKPKHEKILTDVIAALTAHKAAACYTVTSASGEQLAAALLIKHQDRWINIANASSAAGKKNGASHFLFDSLIQQHSEQPIILDFEGSSIPSVARFYESFGAEKETFYHWQYSIADKLKQRFL